MVTAIIVTAILTFFYSEAVGFFIHRLAHWPGSGKLFDNHLEHHSVAYPPGKFLSEEYLGDILTSFVPYFIPAFVITNGLAFLLLSWPLGLTVFLTTTLVSFANNIFHDSFHVKEHWLAKFRWHKKLRSIHFVHHRNVKKNLGIYWYGIDRIFGSFKPSK